MSEKNRIIVKKMVKYCEDSIKYIDGCDFESFSSNELVLTYSIFSLSQLGELVTKLDEVFRKPIVRFPGMPSGVFAIALFTIKMVYSIGSFGIHW